jgi:hypothetical protein
VNAKLSETAKANRARFTTGAELLEWANAHFEGGGHKITYAENAQGETIGKRDAGPFAEVRMNGDWA